MYYFNKLDHLYIDPHMKVQKFPCQEQNFPKARSPAHKEKIKATILFPRKSVIFFFLGVWESGLCTCGKHLTPGQDCSCISCRCVIIFCCDKALDRVLNANCENDMP